MGLRRLGYAAAIGLTLSVVTGHAMPPVDFEAWRAEVIAAFRDMNERLGEAYSDDEYELAVRGIEDAFFPRLTPKTLGVDQILQLWRDGLLWSDWTGLDISGEVMPTLHAAADAATPDGAFAALVAARIDSDVGSRPVEHTPSAALLARALEHPMLGVLLTTRFAPPWAAAAAEWRASPNDALLASIERAIDAVPDSVYPPNASGGSSLYIALMRSEHRGAETAAERFRTRLLDSVRRGVNEHPDMPPEHRDHSEEAIAWLESAPGRVRLFGSMAPRLDFVWASVEPAPETLADFHGKVVLLSFWATWCGPCVGSFPNLRALRAHYEGLPFEIVGVTSVQGYTYLDGEEIRHEAPEDEHADANLSGAASRDMARGLLPAAPSEP